MKLPRVLLFALALTLSGTLRAQDEEAPAEPAPADVVEEVPADPIDAQAQQYEQMLQPKMWRELEFIKQNCDLTPDQRPKIKAAADAGVKKAAKEVLQQAQRGNHEADPGAMIRKDLLKTLEETLTKDQIARYREQASRRAAALKKTTIQSVVAELDGYLYLTREQRDNVTQALDANWQDSWESWLMIWQYGGRYFPMIPDQHLVPHLSEKQKSVWQGVQKVNPGFWGGGGLRQQVNDDWWEGKEESEMQQQTDAPKVEAQPE